MYIIRAGKLILISSYLFNILAYITAFMSVRESLCIFLVLPVFSLSGLRYNH